MTISKALKELRDQAKAFQRHCEHLELRDRVDFQLWMITNLTSDELVSLIDGEVTRQAIFEVYLNDKY